MGNICRKSEDTNEYEHVNYGGQGRAEINSTLQEASARPQQPNKGQKYEVYSGSADAYDEVNTNAARPRNADNARNTTTEDIGSAHAYDSVNTVVAGPSYTGNVGTSASFERTVIPNEKRNALICAAIDIGTTYSGYAYSFRDEPQNIFTNYWDGKNIKTPTVVLLNTSNKFDSFGLEAKAKYEKLMKTGKHTEWYLFERFKMYLSLQNGLLDKDMNIEDFTGKKMPAIDVFSEVIKYMKDHLMGVLQKRGKHVKLQNDDIHWVLTVPAIWNDLSKVFMRQAAQRAGIASKMLTLALEPEAASLYCQRSTGANRVMEEMPVGCRYMVLDLGGGTADITCHEVSQDKTLKEIHRPTGGDFGGTTVDNEFIKILRQIFGKDITNAFKNDHMAEYWELLNDFETKKRVYDGSDKMVVQFSTRLYELYGGNETTSSVAGKAEFKHGKIFIKQELATPMFDVAVNEIKKVTDTLMQNVSGISHIILVGGFSESPYVQKVMRESFRNLIVVPKDPSRAVVSGAVIYGHESRAISTRVCKFTYGIAKMMRYKEHHPITNMRVMPDGVVMVDDVFNKHIEIGEEVDTDKKNEVKAHEYFPTIAEMKQAVLEVYASTQKNPQFVTDDGCQLVGIIKVDIDPKGDKYAKILVKLIFGGTEIFVEVQEEKTGKITMAAVDFLG